MAALPSHPACPGALKGRGRRFNRQGAWQVGLAGQRLCSQSSRAEARGLSLGNARLCNGSPAQICSSARLEGSLFSKTLCRSGQVGGRAGTLASPPC